MAPEIVREDFGKMKVLAIFKTGKKDMIVGGKVTTGKMINNSQIEIMRNDNVIGRGRLSNLQQNKIDTNEVAKNNECGITFDGETKIKEGDTIVCFKEEVRKKTL
jgi:translation initiation factor IF-2